jgi:hypothetical protein
MVELALGKIFIRIDQFFLVCYHSAIEPYNAESSHHRRTRTIDSIKMVQETCYERCAAGGHSAVIRFDLQRSLKLIWWM